jgi:uncharacterized OsmC-like protein
MISKSFYGAQDYANSTVGAPGAMHQNAGSPADMLTHCIGACEVAKGEGVCKKAGIDARKYLQDREPNADTSGEDKMDLENNKIGFQISDSGGDCKKGCQKALADGTLWTIDQLPPHKTHPAGPPPPFPTPGTASP